MPKKKKKNPDATEQSCKDHGNYGVVGEIAHERTYWKNQINLIK